MILRSTRKILKQSSAFFDRGSCFKFFSAYCSFLQGRSGAKEIEKACKNWIIVSAAKNRPEVDVLTALLDEGEAETIALGQELNASLLLIDNKEPRNFARKIGMPFIGALGIIKLAAKRGMVKNPAEIIWKLRDSGFWMSDTLIQQVLNDIDVSMKEIP